MSPSLRRPSPDPPFCPETPIPTSPHVPHLLSNAPAPLHKQPLRRSRRSFTRINTRSYGRLALLILLSILLSTVMRLLPFVSLVLATTALAASVDDYVATEGPIAEAGLVGSRLHFLWQPVVVLMSCHTARQHRTRWFEVFRRSRKLLALFPWLRFTNTEIYPGRYCYCVAEHH